MAVAVAWQPSLTATANTAPAECSDHRLPLLVLLAVLVVLAVPAELVALVALVVLAEVPR